MAGKPTEDETRDALLEIIEATHEIIQAIKTLALAIDPEGGTILRLVGGGACTDCDTGLAP